MNSASLRVVFFTLKNSYFWPAKNQNVEDGLHKISNYQTYFSLF
jgi:hypothetical protein